MRFRLLLFTWIVFAVNACGVKNATKEDSAIASRMDDIPNPAVDPDPIVDYNLWKIENGKFYLAGKWIFLKIAKPLLNYSG